MLRSCRDSSAFVRRYREGVFSELEKLNIHTCLQTVDMQDQAFHLSRPRK
jgi:hypothetical protein